MINKSLRPVIAFLTSYLAINLLVFLVMRPDTQTHAWLAGWVQDSPFTALGMLFLVQQVVTLALLAGVWYVRHVHRSMKSMIAAIRVHFHRHGWKLAWKVVGSTVLFYICINIVLVVLTQVYGIQIPGLYGEQLVMQALSALPFELWRQKILVFIAVVLVGPLVEEIIYRGFLTTTLMEVWGKWGVIVASAIFAVVHMERGVVLNLFLLALLLGYIYWKTKSLWYSLLFHMLINGLAMCVLLFVPTIT